MLPATHRCVRPIGRSARRSSVACTEQHVSSANITTGDDTGRDLGRIILRNTIALTIGGWITRLLNFVFIIYAVRMLGDEGLGKYATIVAFVGLFGVFFELGLSQFVERNIAQGRKNASDLFWNLFALRMILAIVGVVAITLLAAAIGYEQQLVLGILLFTLTFVFAAFATPLTTLLTANERFDLSTAIGLVTQIVNIAAGLFFLLTGSGFMALVYTGFVAMPVQIGLTYWTVRRFNFGPPPFRIDFGSWRGFIVAALPFGLTSLALVFNFNVDTVIIGWFHPDSDVGLYNAAYRLVFNAVGIMGGFMVAITPSLAREHMTDPERVRRWVRASTHWLVLFTLPAAAGLSLLAPRVIRLLYGAQFDAAWPALAIIAWDIPLLMLLAFFGNVTAAVGLEKPAAKIYLVASAVNLALNLALIPLFGILAAAAVTIVTDVITGVLFLALLRDQLELRRTSGAYLRMVLATGAMALIVWVANPLPLAVVIGMGTLAFIVFALALGLVDRSLTDALLRRVRRRSLEAFP
ncbi:MAG: hypothetical protein DCC58_08435 [Chloroflexi bacterium]|nr:MAG: hypothetical protein DCC58_08435 [Chloroflexota bacterium]